MPHDPKLTGRLQLHSEPEFARVDHDAEIRSAEGRRIDTARAEFRAAWQEKKSRKQRDAESARQREEWFSYAPRRVLIGGAVCGVAGYVLLGVAMGGAPDFLIMGAMVGGVVGLLALLPLALLALLGQGYWQKRAERLEREAREMEQF